ncbi:MAG: DEDD exonuclease domain-containing protein [Actinomycetes bacterium]
MSDALSSVKDMRSTPAQHQLSLDDVGTPLIETTFVIVDLETTGGGASDCITEIGAVKVQGGQVLGEFATLVDPGTPISAMISVLTGITDSMVANAPSLDEVLPSFLEFLGNATLVAHNAGFDVGFLKRACVDKGYTWPRPAIVDTVKVARASLSRDEVPNVKLATLAHFFNAPTQPTHRALDDARATVHVLHCLIERLGTLHVRSLEDLLEVSTQVPDKVRRKSALADHLPDSPGVYQFKDGQGQVLYIGTSKSIKRRVRTYFTAAETRKRIKYMVSLVESVTAIPCPTALEARIRELRLIAQYQPQFNQRSRKPEKTYWIDLTHPRLLLRAGLTGPSDCLGPFASRSNGEAALACLASARLEHDGLDLKTLASSPELIVHTVMARIQFLVQQERFEDAAQQRDRLAAYLTARRWSDNAQQLARSGLLVATAPTSQRQGCSDVVVITHGRFAASATVKDGQPLKKIVDALVATAPFCEPSLLPPAIAEESTALMLWLQTPGLRLIELDGSLHSSLTCAEKFLHVYPHLRGHHTSSRAPGKPSGPQVRL